MKPKFETTCLENINIFLDQNNRASEVKSSKES